MPVLITKDEVFTVDEFVKNLDSSLHNVAIERFQEKDKEAQGGRMAVDHKKIIVSFKKARLKKLLMKAGVWTLLICAFCYAACKQLAS